MCPTNTSRGLSVLKKVQTLAAKIVDAGWFTHGITIIIIFNALVVGLDTSSYLHERFSIVFQWINDVILVVFILEALAKMMSTYPRCHLYFNDGWNIFDFAIIIFCLIPTTGQLATIARLARVLRVLRLVSALPQLRVLVTALIHSVPGMFNIVLLMSIIFYVYGVTGYHLFHDVDPTHWRTLGISMLTLFRIVTLEDWTDIMYTALDHYWWAWIYFLSFVVVGTFVIINLFIGIVITNVQEAREKSLQELRSAIHSDEVIAELQQTRDALQRVQERLESEGRQQPVGNSQGVV